MGGMDGARLEGVMTNLNSALQRAAADHGERPAVRIDGLGPSHSQLWEAAGRMTAGRYCAAKCSHPRSSDDRQPGPPGG